MRIKDKDDKFSKNLPFKICRKFDELQFYCGRFSNNNEPEVMAIYLYVMHHEGHFKIKHIHRFACEYLRSWFPKLVSYQAFNNRLNRLSGVFPKLVELLLTYYQPEDCCLGQSLLDPYLTG